jgi:hypothetical protein
MKTAFVLGNGVSRQAVNPDTLRTRGHVYGCNALYREFEPDVLVSTDAPISAQIQNSGYSNRRVHYTRKPLLHLGSRRIPPDFFGFSSGPAAVGIAAQENYKAIYLLGFDMGPTRSGRFNNVYADTEFYKKSSANPTYTGNWVRQITTIVNRFPDIKFVRIMGDTTADIAALHGIKNLFSMPLEEFLDRINNAKDL